MSRNLKDSCIHELFERQARRSPQAPALSDPQETLTYEELDDRAERLAGRLREAGVGPGRTVGVYLERCAGYVVACLAALKAGGAFLPLDPAYPGSLLAEVLSEAGPRVVLTDGRHAGRLPEEQPRLCLEDGGATGTRAPAETSNSPGPTAGDLAFVAYSSGTTGRPKGIENTHRAAVRSYLWRFGVSDNGPGDRVGCNVFFIWEVLRPLLRGATSCVIPDDVVYDPEALVRFLGGCRISEVLMTPSLLQAVLDTGESSLKERLGSLKVLWLNGEVVTRALARRAIQALPDTRLLNVYSISETHEVAAGDIRELYDNASARHCPVGYPKDPEGLYILGEDGHRLPAGEVGEIHVGGDGLAQGYVNLPETTARRFLKDPFSPEVGARMYRSGDRGRLLPDSSLEVLGRCDFMVKVRGYSIELGSVEAAVERHLAVRGCAVVAEGDEGEDKRLVAYLVPAEPAGRGERGERYAGWKLDEKTGFSPEIRRRLRDSLPHYAIPAVFVELDALPLQPATGKVDRDRLPSPPPRRAPDARATTYTVPAEASHGEKETVMARLFEGVLALEKGDVGREDDFFDAGGHSLAAAELAGRIEESFGVRLPVSALLEAPTPAGLLDALYAQNEREPGEEQETTLERMQADAVLDPDIAPEPADGPPVTPARARRILLTGATGFLGAFLLDGLLRATGAEVHCLVRPRRDGTETGPMAPIRANLERYGLWEPGYRARIHPVVGDLEKPRLGVSEETFNGLARDMDLIIHAGARVNLIYPYSALRAANVSGTREVLRLAARHRPKPLHHVSTTGIFPSGGHRCLETADLDNLAAAREDGYGQTKWVAEKLVREAADRGLAVSVYRPGNVSGHSVTGVSNDRDLLGALIVESLRSGCAPRIENWRLEMTPVDFVSRAILHLANDPANFGGTFHLADPEPASADAVFTNLETLGYPLQRLDYRDWLQARRSSRRKEEGEDVIHSILGEAGPETTELWDANAYDDTETRRALYPHGPRRPAIDANLLAAYARFFAARGWIETPNPVPERSPV